MDELERRLRAAMIGAAEAAPPGLLPSIYRRHRRHGHRVIAGYVAVASVVVLAIPPLAIDLSGRLPVGGSTASHPATQSGPSFSRGTSVSAAAAGTMVLTCHDANWGQLQSNWRSVSLKEGPLWFVFGRRDGYVHESRFRTRGHSSSGPASRGDDVMIVEVADGATVTMKPEPAARNYFHFVDGFNGPSPYALPAGDTGFTFIACPRDDTGPNGQVTDFYLGFFITAGRAAPIDIWPRPDARPIRVIFTCPARPAPCG
jgi:hypothetical protein